MDEKRLIDAYGLESYLLALFKFFGSFPCSEEDKVTQYAIKRCIGEVKKMPTVDAVEVVHGLWISPTKINGRSFNIFHCSVCNGVPPGVNEHTKYCSHCGAKMDGDMNG